MDNSWVKLYRKIADNDIVRDPTALQVFIWILIHVNKKTGIYTTGRFLLSEQLDIKPSTIRDALYRLRDKYKVADIKTDNKKSTIILLNWAKYQSSDKQPTQPDDNQTTTRRQPDDTKQDIDNREIENNINNGKAQKIKFSPKEFIKGSTVSHSFSTIGGETPRAYKENQQIKSGIHTEWQEKAFRYATTLGIDLETPGVKPRWLKIFKDASKGIRAIDLEKATGYLIDYPRKLPSEEKIKLFFWIYMNNKKMKEGYVASN